jgi:hypothetical protein
MDEGTAIVPHEPTRIAKLPHFRQQLLHHKTLQLVVCGVLSLDHAPRRFRVVTQLLQQ